MYMVDKNEELFCMYSYTNMSIPIMIVGKYSDRNILILMLDTQTMTKFVV